MTLTAFVGALLLTGCKGKTERAEGPHEEKNAVYYWRTTLELDGAERDFIGKNDVKRMYLRFFDIVVDKSPIAMDAVVPNATLQVKDSIPVKDFIPTIFIAPDAMEKMKANEEMWAEKIVKRVYNMCSYNELGVPSEIQLDCDWTAQTDSSFFALCKAVKNQLIDRNPDAKLSATIRLHQLRSTPPPVDYGVLMLYNTGSFKNPNEKNSIISEKDITPYLNNLSDYPIHLDFAYPIFSWNLVYSQTHFKGLVNSNSALPPSILQRVSQNEYKIIKDTVINDVFLYEGDLVRHEDAPFKTIMKVKKLIEKNSRTKSSIILYHLDNQNLSNYTSDEFKEIYSGRDM